MSQSQDTGRSQTAESTNPQVSVITLGVKDPAEAKQFYEEAFGYAVSEDHGQFVRLSITEGASDLALYRTESLADDAGVDGEGSGFLRFTFSHIVGSADAVDQVMARAERAGAKIIKPARRQFWGGYSGYVRDPDGFLWKVASNKGHSRLRRQQPAAVTTTPRESVLTIGVSDMKRAKAFYGDGLGCPIDKNYAKFVSFDLGPNSSTLALYRTESLADDAGLDAESSGFRRFTFSYVVDSADVVDEVLGRAERAGATIIKLGERAPWGGYSGTFSDPDGHIWKVAASQA